MRCFADLIAVAASFLSRHSRARNDRGVAQNTKRSLMPEGFEKLGADGVADLLEFLKKGRKASKAA